MLSSAKGRRRASRNVVLFSGALLLCVGLAVYLGASRALAEHANGDYDWPNHGKDLANTRFQNLDQINPGNVKNLQVAWVFHTGVLDALAELEASPIEVGGKLFITDGHDNVFALNAATGQMLGSLTASTMRRNSPHSFYAAAETTTALPTGTGTCWWGDFVFFGEGNGTARAL